MLDPRVVGGTAWRTIGHLDIADVSLGTLVSETADAPIVPKFAYKLARFVLSNRSDSLLKVVVPISSYFELPPTPEIFASVDSAGSRAIRLEPRLTLAAARAVGAHDARRARAARCRLALLCSARTARNFIESSTHSHSPPASGVRLRIQHRVTEPSLERRECCSKPDAQRQSR